MLTVHSDGVTLLGEVLSVSGRNSLETKVTISARRRPPKDYDILELRRPFWKVLYGKIG